MADNGLFTGLLFLFILFASVGFGLLFSDAGLPASGVLMKINGWEETVGTVYHTSLWTASGGDGPDTQQPLVYYNYGGEVTVLDKWAVSSNFQF